MSTCPPLALIVFNRPDVTERVFEAVRAAEPRQLFVLADGPRADRPEEAERCAETRAIFDRVDWECDVHRRLADENLGCGASVAEGLDWVFEHVDRVVVLEDDCLPDPSFFPFCADLLERFADDERIMHVSGSNLGSPPAACGGASYGFTTYPTIWGWATWRRAWGLYDREMKTWPRFRDAGLVETIPANRRWRATLARDWEICYRKGPLWRHQWAYQWQYSIVSESGLCVSPAVNLVANVGFGAAGAHTTLHEHEMGDVPVGAVERPLRHPEFVAVTPAVQAHIQRVELRRTGPVVGAFRRLVPSRRARLLIKKAMFFRERSAVHPQT